MKKLRKILCVAAAALSLTATAASAENLLNEDFNKWVDMYSNTINGWEYTVTGAHRYSVYTDEVTGNKYFGISNGGSIKKTFDTAITGKVEICYDVMYQEDSYDSYLVVGLDGTDANGKAVNIDLLNFSPYDTVWNGIVEVRAADSQNNSAGVKLDKGSFAKFKFVIDLEKDIVDVYKIVDGVAVPGGRKALSSTTDIASITSIDFTKAKSEFVLVDNVKVDTIESNDESTALYSEDFQGWASVKEGMLWGMDTSVASNRGVLNVEDDGNRYLSIYNGAEPRVTVAPENDTDTVSVSYDYSIDSEANYTWTNFEDSNGKAILALYYKTTSSGQIEVRVGGVSGYGDISIGVLEAGEFRNIKAVFDGANRKFRIYIDSVVAAEGNYPAAVGNTTVKSVVWYGIKTTGYFHLDNIVIDYDVMDMVYLSNSFDNGAPYKYQYRTDNDGNRYNATNELGKSILKIEGGVLDAAYVKNDAGRKYLAVAYVPAKIDSGLLEVSFDAKWGGEENMPAYVNFYHTGNNSFAELVIRPEGSIAINHEYGMANSNGAYAGNVDVTGANNYKIIFDLDNNVYDLYIDNVYVGQFIFKLGQENMTNPFSYMGFTNITIDNLVVKKAELMREYNYTYVLGEEETAPVCNTITDITGFAGKQLVTNMTISNPTKLDKTAVLASAVYDADKTLVSVALSDTKTLNKDTELTTFTATHDTALPADVTGYTAKTFVFETMTNIKPVYDYLLMD